jgi:hypothetical protein
LRHMVKAPERLAWKLDVHGRDRLISRLRRPPSLSREGGSPERGSPICTPTSGRSQSSSRSTVPPGQNCGWMKGPR